MKEHEHPENYPEYKGLRVNKGISKMPAINPDAANKFIKRKRKQLSAEEYIEGILSGDIIILSKAVTLIESARSDHQSLAQEIITGCLPHSGKSIRIGITGVPGAGKSTFIEALGMHVISRGGKVAVLAIDPSSSRSKGSILGDKTRMERLSTDKNAYIRPTPSAGSLGGVARKTKETIILCEAAGFEVILVETVGVGQSEIAVHSMVDFFLLLMLAGAGDELQGIKRGIMEMADAILINKADGDNKQRAELARREYANALHLFPPTESGWIPQTQTCSAYTGEGISHVWDIIDRYLSETENYFAVKRKRQNLQILYDTIEYNLQLNFKQNQEVKEMRDLVEKQISRQEISPYQGAEKLLSTYFKNLHIGER